MRMDSSSPNLAPWNMVGYCSCLYSSSDYYSCICVVCRAVASGGDSGGFEWVDGVVVKAVERGQWLLLVTRRPESVQ